MDDNSPNGCLIFLLLIQYYILIVLFILPLVFLLGNFEALNSAAAPGLDSRLFNAILILTAGLGALYAIHKHKSVSEKSAFCAIALVFTFLFWFFSRIAYSRTAAHITVTLLTGLYLLVIFKRVFKDKTSYNTGGIARELRESVSGRPCLLLGNDEERRLEESERTLMIVRIAAAILTMMLSCALFDGIALLWGTLNSGADPLKKPFAVIAAAVGFCGAIFCLTQTDPKTFLRVDFPTRRRFSPEQLLELLQKYDTVLGKPRLAQIRGQGSAALYGPLEIGVFVYVVPFFFRKKISVRLMTAPSRILNNEKYSRIKVPEIDEELNLQLIKKQIGRIEHIDFEPILGPMAAEIARMLNDDI